ncbi:transcriptional antiterminator RfaH [Babesia caballi]|uniref:Transcriptional antiterminator RfaH n=1 Tax=Babesia caballi TaxID=5871 RepID=A0AAV4LPU3_BABCB|nr:transcriptional antiterminator RfaH [Babesia caballi]
MTLRQVSTAAVVCGPAANARGAHLVDALATLGDLGVKDEPSGEQRPADETLGAPVAVDLQRAGQRLGRYDERSGLLEHGGGAVHVHELKGLHSGERRVSGRGRVRRGALQRKETIGHLVARGHGRRNSAIGEEVAVVVVDDLRAVGDERRHPRSRDAPRSVQNIEHGDVALNSLAALIQTLNQEKVRLLLEQRVRRGDADAERLAAAQEGGKQQVLVAEVETVKSAAADDVVEQQELLSSGFNAGSVNSQAVDVAELAENLAVTVALRASLAQGAAGHGSVAIDARAVRKGHVMRGAMCEKEVVHRLCFTARRGCSRRAGCGVRAVGVRFTRREVTRLGKFAVSV